jgi:hypothetical protein
MFVQAGSAVCGRWNKVALAAASEWNVKRNRDGRATFRHE